MASIQDQIKNARTLEDIINLLSILFTNMNNQNRMYYDMFLNPEPLTLKLERYNEDGVLETVDINNRAKDKIVTYSGQGNPENVVVASVGATYIDLLNNAFYYKTQNGASGWNQVMADSSRTLFLEKNGGDASNLVMIPMKEALGVLNVANGGTGVSSITGLIKGNGTSAFSNAIDGVDYVGPKSSVGVVSYYAGTIENVPDGWLVCDGSEYSKTTYSALYNKIRDIYGKASNEANFKVPNLIDIYIKGGTVSGVLGGSQIGSHTHKYGGDNLLTGNNGLHNHSRGTMNITGVAGTSWMSKGDRQKETLVGEGGRQINGCFFKIEKGTKVVYEGGTFKLDANNNPVTEKDSKAVYFGVNDNSAGTNDPGMGFNAAKSWTGATSQTGNHNHTIPEATTKGNNLDSNGKDVDMETDVKHVTMIPIIKY